jgi:hypothetical protein
MTHFSDDLRRIIDHGIFHGINIYAYRESRANTGLWQAIDIRME